MRIDFSFSEIQNRERKKRREENIISYLLYQIRIIVSDTFMRFKKINPFNNELFHSYLFPFIVYSNSTYIEIR